MPAIQFDVLCPPAAAEEIGAAFQRALDILAKHGKLHAGTARDMGQVLVDDTVATQLRSTYANDRGEDPEHDGAKVHRFRIEAEGVDSYNRLAMGLSRILTPKATLPADPAALEQEERFEVPAIYPWTVEVLR